MATTAPTAMAVDPLVEPQSVGLTRAGAVRLQTIDMLRGLVIAIMVLDHVRDFFHVSANAFDPTDPSKSYLLLYMTRWVTHLCAPTFVFLSGVSIYLQKVNGKTGSALTRFLVTRGLWLVFLELTLIMFAWNFGKPFWLIQVIWVIGWSMVAMAALAHLPSRVVLGLGVLMVVLSPLALPPFGPLGTPSAVLMAALFGGGFTTVPPAFFAYAIVPWLGVMAIGFGLGPIYRMDPAERRKRLGGIALGLLVLFALARTLNGYGDPRAWASEASAGRTVLAYFDVSKYPPSPDYVMVTLGISMLLFLALEHLRGPLARIFVDFGRTPLFTYIAHLYIAHGLMLAAAIALGRPEAALNLFTQILAQGKAPVGWGFSLGVVYAVWLLVLALLVPLSRWMADLKRRRRDWWLSYI